ILTCLIYDWADHRQVSDLVTLVSEPWNFHDIKSTRLEEVDILQNLDLLNKWTIPRVNIKTIYDYGWFDKISNKQLIKTSEQSLAVTETFLTLLVIEILIFKLIFDGLIESHNGYGPIYFNAEQICDYLWPILIS
ncbi:hypothetical protein H5410_001520, partial [Solanum commersonii]